MKKSGNYFLPYLSIVLIVFIVAVVVLIINSGKNTSLETVSGEAVYSYAARRHHVAQSSSSSYTRAEVDRLLAEKQDKLNIACRVVNNWGIQASNPAEVFCDTDEIAVSGNVFCANAPVVTSLPINRAGYWNGNWNGEFPAGWAGQCHSSINPNIDVLCCEI